MSLKAVDCLRRGVVSEQWSLKAEDCLRRVVVSQQWSLKAEDCLRRAVASEQWFLNSFPNKPWFSCVCSTSHLKIVWVKEKLLVTSNFSFSHSVFYPFRKFILSSNLELTSANSHFGRDCLIQVPLVSNRGLSVLLVSMSLTKL